MIHRPFNKSIIQQDNFIKISKTERLADEIYYYQTIQRFEQKKHFAEFRGDLSDGVNFALKLKLYDAKNFYESYNFNSLNFNSSFEKIIQIASDLHSVEPNYLSEDIDNSQINFKILIEKTTHEFAKFINKSNIYLDHLKWKNYLIINDQKCLHFQEIWPYFKNLIYKNYLHADLNLIHGDLCFANILHENNSNLILIDPRGSYHQRGCFGDKAYDYAKLLHSVHGNYEQIIYDDFIFNLESDKVNYSFKNNFFDFHKILIERIDPILYQKSKLIEGLLFISMCSRHYDNELHQFIMYCQGLKILNEVYNESIQDFKLATV